MPLRPYQAAASRALAVSLVSHRSALVSMATGTGKTWVAADVMVRAHQAGWHVLFLAHREELLDQATQTLMATARVPLGLVKADREDWHAPIVLASVQSLTSERLRRMPPYHLIVTDEGHHSPAPSYERVYAAARALYPQVRHAGFTATHYRSIGGGRVEGLEGTFEEVCFEYGLKRAIDEGWLVPEIRALRVPTGHVLHGVSDGDFATAGLNNDARNGIIVGAYRATMPWYPSALAFCVDVLHAKELARRFRVAGVPAQAMWGAMDQELGPGARKAALESLRSGRARVLTTVALLTEGVDLPMVSALLMGRPTASLVLWMQMLGRGTRPWAGKRLLGVLDFTDNVSARLDLRPAGLADVVESEHSHSGPYELFRVARRVA